MIRRIVSQSWGLLLVFAAWQVWVMASHYNSIVAVSPVAVVRDIVLHPVVYLLPAFWTLAFALSGLTAGLLFFASQYFSCLFTLIYMKKILVVDDDKDLLANMKAYLKRQGFEVTVTTSCAEGL